MKGTIGIRRYTPGDEIHIRVEDETSHTEFLDVTLTLEQLGSLVSRSGNVDCTFELRAQYVGMIYEYKELVVPVPQFYPTPQQIETALIPYEVEGWEGRRSDVGNHHKHAKVDGQDAYRVHFGRYVKPSEEQ